MTSALDRIKAAMAASGAPATTPETLGALPPLESVAPPAAAPVAAAPAPAAEPMMGPPATEPVQASVPAVIEATTEVAIVDPGEAKQALSLFFGPQTNLPSLADIAEGVDGEGGVRFSHPFCTLRKGNWEVHKGVEPTVSENMPVGNRAFRAVFLGYRIGLLGWAGGSTVGGGGQPPMWGAALPTPMGDKASPELVRKALLIGNKVQYTKRAERVKFDAIGRLTPELHMFLWTPATGFFVAVASGQATTKDSMENIRPIEGKINGLPVMFSVVTTPRHNPKATNPDARDWDVDTVRFDAVVDERALALKQEFDALQQRDPVGLANEVLKFHRADDYDGLRGTALVDKLAQYDQFLSGR